MTSSIIRRLASQMPADADYFRGTPRSLFERPGQLTSQERVAKCLSDPSFGWHFARTLADAGLELPSIVIEQYVVRAYFSFQADASDEVVEAAHALAGPTQHRDRAILRALFMAKDINCEYIARLTGLSVPVVEAFGQLFFNVRDRREDRLYLAGILFPAGRVREIQNGDPEPDLVLLRAGHDEGALRVAQVAGLLPERSQSTSNNAGRDLETGLLHRASSLMEAGVSSSPVVRDALKLIAAGKNSGEPTNPLLDNSQSGLGAISKTVNLMEAVKKYCSVHPLPDSAPAQTEGMRVNQLATKPARPAAQVAA